MNTFLQYNPTKLYFGKGQVEQLQQEIPENANVLLVYGGGSIKRNGVYDDVMKQLNDVDATVFELTGVEPNPRLTTVRKGVEICKREGIDFLLAVGGGSVIDCTKAIAVGATYEGDVWDLITQQAPIESALPFGTVLTLAATGSEMNPVSVITNWETNDKLGWSSPHAFPTFSVLDPEYTFSVPQDQTIYGIVDSMSHALEHYFHRTPNTPMIDGFIESLLRTAIETGPKLVENPQSYEYRETMMYISTTAFNETLKNGTDGGDWATHRIEHAVSAIYDIPHGGGLAILFPNWLHHVIEEDPSRVKQLATNVFGISAEGKSDEEVAREGAEALRAFWDSLGAPRTLGDYDITDEDFDSIVEKTLIKPGVGTYVEMNGERVLDILQRSL
ncbi:NADH-dependent butanol dehydrogenase A [Pontibacillus halophilus JSM 076056 = DSM 19796]|uniref:NADH-dependent butanol dehydrogenase A n=1 Tax=Pontibacillus halophilus JSM 076056 = DSM 19796 TaxID=1385510 RepID=A0A0A5I5I1_9BACI|nr:iron-containing alcohol dehydrogenase [Pontibacillus halophilus]KGX91082.1 NADH-dependent butanol dehydrogenase A [Pontibacillus halophilus JSM 076056 = DSM 19796]